MITAALANTAFQACPAVEASSLETFLDPVLDMEPEALRHLAGYPGQVLACQFTSYVKSSVQLRECLQRDRQPSSALAEMVIRLPTKAGSRTQTKEH